MADCLAALMHDVLGFSRFAAQGGDWGAGVTSRLGYAHADKMIGIHINLMMAAGRDPKAFQNPTEEDKLYLGELAHWMREETGYQWIQGTRPQTLSFALTDSPVGLAAWIVEKFRAWSDCGGDVERAISRDRMLADISLYWFTGAIGSSFWPYYARLHGSVIQPPGETITVPTGYAQFPRNPQTPAQRGRKGIQEYPALERDGKRRAFRRARTAGAAGAGGARLLPRVALNYRDA
jgi:hypothetical protein